MARYFIDSLNGASLGFPGYVVRIGRIGLYAGRHVCEEGPFESGRLPPLSRTRQEQVRVSCGLWP